MKKSADPLVFKKLEKAYYEMAFTELAFEYYCLKERDLEQTESDAGEKSEYRDRIEKLIGECFNDYDDLKEIGDNATVLREEIKERVGRLVKKLDRMDLDRYLSEREGSEDEAFDYPDNDEAARVVLRNIFNVNDNAIVNERIKKAVYELPVRMTKNRFFDIVENSLKKYIGAEKDILQRIIYMIESTAGIAGDEIISETPDDGDMIHVRNEYENLNDLMGICNYICVIGMCSEEIRNTEKENITELLKLIRVSSELSEEKAADAEKILSKLEGKLEDLSQRISTYESGIDSMTDPSLDDSEDLKKLQIMGRLMSTSVYADLEIGDESEAGEKDVASEFKKLSEKMNESFKNGDRALNRARMAAVLGVLPVFFNSKTEVMNYVRESLMNCSNSHEKNVAISNILSSDLYRYMEE